MSRRTRFALSLTLVSLALAAAACADTTGPNRTTPCATSNSNTCVAADYNGPNV